ncbi:equilibrative nucleotide transporter 8-like [Primulina huaijiensis]|uniref:equilibrative nucleotide transporter 8-like n=1 Tax=Primulina huaijiensis TaxID=1492673 RepID=UPI003CC72C4F
MEGGKINSIKDSNPPPKDSYRIAYILHFFLRAGNLLPWNALITAVDYFEYLYPNRHIERVFSVVYMSSSLLVLILLLSWDFFRRSLSLRFRMNLGFSMLVLSLTVTPIMGWCWRKNGRILSSDAAFDTVVASVFVCGIADGLVGGSLVGTAGKLPKQYMQAIFAGTASSWVMISTLRIITKASLPQTPQGLKISAQFYFIVSSVILLICIICCNLLCKLRVMQHHYSNLQDGFLPLGLSSPKFLQTIAKIRWPSFGIFMIYTVTLSIFPGFLAENLGSTTLRDWYPVMLIATYNLSDFVGKSLTGVYVMSGIRKATWGCVLRILFYPLFICYFRGPKWMRTEAPVVVLTVMLGLSNGYLTSVIMILTPKAVPPQDSEVAAIVMAVMLGLGLAAGSVIGWFWII